MPDPKSPEPETDPELFREFLPPEVQNFMVMKKMQQDMVAGGFSEEQSLKVMGAMLAHLVSG